MPDLEALTNISNGTNLLNFFLSEKYSNLTKLNAKLNDRKTTPKTYWWVINIFINNKEVLICYPIYPNTYYIFCCEGKSTQWPLQNTITLFQKNSSLPSFEFKTDKYMATLNITEDNISNIIKSLNPNKSRYWGGISIKFI